MTKKIKRLGCLAVVLLLGIVAWKGLGSTAGHSDSTENKVLLEVPYLNQNDYPTGCESVSTVMLLRYFDIDIDVDTFIDRYLDCGSISEKSGALLGPSPNDKFVGDPRQTASYGCWAPVIERALEKLLPKRYTVQNLTGSALPQLAEDYLNRQTPLLIWATMDMAEPYPSASWVNEKDGSTVQWLANEHCMVLVGYDDNNYYCNDPYQNNGVVAIPRTLLETRFRQMGYQALAVLPKAG